MEKKRPGVSGAKRALLIVLCCVLAVVLALLVTAAIVSDDVLSQIQRPSDNPTLSSSEIEDILNGDDSATVTGPTIQEGDIDFGGEVTEVIGSGELINILLIGQDARAEGTQRNSDAMILCTINTATKTLTMTSFLRDMYVQIPGYGGNKINACYPLGGMSLLDKCLEQNFGVKVDANVAVDFSGFMKLIDMVGGVKINLTADEANYLNYRGNWDVTGNDGWQLKAGENVLTGSQALAYSRIRALGLDFERTERQRKVITSLIEKAKGMNMMDLYGLIKQGASMISTDMNDDDIRGYLGKLLPMLTDLNIVTQRVPVDGSYEFSNVGRISDCIVLNFDVNRKFLAETLNP